ncbi:MAG: hypothetical protein ABI970_22480 [Chloroflexota bacterium]
MRHFYVRLATLCFLIFTVMLLVIHAQPYDDHELRNVLLPEGCPAPCFMGIRPGVTKMASAITLLEGNEWVETIEKTFTSISWDWSNRIPDGFKEGIPGSLEIRNNNVNNILVTTNYSLGDIRLALGLPDLETIVATSRSKYLLYTAFYNQYGLLVQRYFACPVIEPFRETVGITIKQPTETTPTKLNSINDLFRTCLG